MKHDITALDLLLYLYDEVSYLKKMAIEHELAQNIDLRYELEQLRQTNELLDAAHEEQPPAPVLQNILQYSRSTSTPKAYR